MCKNFWQEAYAALEIARLEVGREHLEWAALSVNSTIEVDIRPRSIMGVVIPRVSSAGAPPETPYGLGNTTVALDEAALRFRVVLERIPELAEVMTKVWRLARELRKTQRRVNALEYVLFRNTKRQWLLSKALWKNASERSFSIKAG